MVRPTQVVAVMLVLAAGAASAPAALINSYTFNNFIDANANDSNLDGTWDTLRSGPLIDLLAYTGRPDYYYRGGLEFNIASLPPEVHILDATLFVSYDGASGTPAQTLQFYGFKGDGKLELADFQTGASSPVGPRYNAFGPGGDGYYRVPVTSFMQSLADQDATHAGFMVENLANNQTALGGYFSLRPPRLEVSYTILPEPGTAAFATFGLAALALRRRRVKVLSGGTGAAAA